MDDIIINLAIGIAFITTDIILYIHIAKKYKTYNFFKITKFWINEYM